MYKSSRIFVLFAAFIVVPLLASEVEAACPAFPQVSWWGKLTHAGVKAYVQQKHGGDWSGYLDKWRRQLAKVRGIHGKGQGIKIPSTGKVLKKQQLSDYINKLAQRVDVTECLSKEKDDTKTITIKKTVKKRMVTPYGEGVIAYKAGNYKAAYDIWLPIANGGNPKAQNALGHLFRKGLGVEADIEKSRQWYAKSAAAGNSVGQYSLGDIARRAAGSKEEMAKAVTLLEKAAMQNYARAQFALGKIHQEGKIIPVNNAEAYFWTTLAVKNNYKKAQALLELLERSLSATDKEAQTLRAEKWLSENKN